MVKPVMITGAGIVSAIGCGKAETLDSLSHQRTGIGKLRYLQTEHREYPVGEVKLSDEEMKRLLGIDSEPTTRSILLGMLAVREALEEAGLESGSEDHIAFISGTTVGGMDKSERYYLDFLANDDHNEYIKTHDCGATTNMIADKFDIFSQVTSISTACSSAANAIIYGANLIRSGRADIVVVGGTESLSKFHFNGFNTLMILDPGAVQAL